MSRLPVGAAIVVAVMAGIAGAVQPKINAELSERLGSDVVTALVSFAVGLVVLLLVALSRSRSRAALRLVPRADTPRWTYFTGLCGACAVTSAVVAVPSIGVALFTIALYAGSVLASLLVDRWGLGPTGRRPLTWQRGVAAVLALSAVVISQLGTDIHALKPSTIFLLAGAVAAGALTAFQSAGGGRFAAAVGDPVTSAVVNFTGGTAALALLVVILAVFGQLPSLSPPMQPDWYVGGALGVVFVTSAFIAVGTLGVMRATLTILAGQLSGSVLLDLLPSGPGLRPVVILGVFIIFSAVALSGLGVRPSRSAEKEAAAANGVSNRHRP